MLRVILLNLVALAAFLPNGMATTDSKRLYEDILSDYNRLIRPVENNTEVLTVQIALKLSQLIEVSLKKQVMKTNVWVEQKWKDYKLRWNPEDYGDVEMLHIPSEKIWLPDIVLYNNADGNYEVNQMTMATVYYTGDIEWNPPAIYKSACEMDVEFFPFDEQQCNMKFGSWTYDGLQVALIHKNKSNYSRIVEEGTDLTSFYLSVEWDILEVPAEHIEEHDSESNEPYPYVKFRIVIRRKTLFYTVNLIAPCVAISFLTVLVFYLPSKSGEKVTLCISILLSLTVFFLLLAEIVPPTSLAVPLVGKYLLFTMIMVTLSVILTVVVLNVHFRSPSTHTLPRWVRLVFIDIIPRLLLMDRPKPYENDGEDENVPKFVIRRCNGKMGDLPIPPPPPPIDSLQDHSRSNIDGRDEDIYMGHQEQDESQQFYQQISAEVQNAFEGVRFIAEHMKKTDDEESIEEDWKYISMVLDRMFLCIFSFTCFVGTAGIICQAPSLYDSRVPIDAIKSKIGKETLA